MEVRKTILFGLATLLTNCWEPDIKIEFERRELKDNGTTTQLYCLKDGTCYTEEGALDYLERKVLK